MLLSPFAVWLVETVTLFWSLHAYIYMHIYINKYRICMNKWYLVRAPACVFTHPHTHTHKQPSASRTFGMSERERKSIEQIGNNVRLPLGKFHSKTKNMFNDESVCTLPMADALQLARRTFGACVSFGLSFFYIFFFIFDSSHVVKEKCTRSMVDGRWSCVRATNSKHTHVWM